LLLAKRGTADATVCDMRTPAPIARRSIMRRVAASLLDVVRTLAWARRQARRSLLDVR